jgi:two-component system NarL family response regulator
MKILVVDRHVLFREGLISLFNEQAEFSVVGEAGSAQEATEKALALKPDAILMDSNLLDEAGLEAMRTILSSQPNTAIVVLSPHESVDLLFVAVGFGAKGYLPKSISKSMLIASLRAIERGETAIPRAMMSQILEEFYRMVRITPRDKAQVKALTFREIEILRQLATEATNTEIAEQLYISDNTVRVHVHNILDKLQVRNRREAAEFARRAGLVNGNNNHHGNGRG